MRPERRCRRRSSRPGVRSREAPRGHRGGLVPGAGLARLREVLLEGASTIAGRAQQVPVSRDSDRLSGNETLATARCARTAKAGTRPRARELIELPGGGLVVLRHAGRRRIRSVGTPARVSTRCSATSPRLQRSCPESATASTKRNPDAQWGARPATRPARAPSRRSKRKLEREQERLDGAGKISGRRLSSVASCATRGARCGSGSPGGQCPGRTSPA